MPLRLVYCTLQYVILVKRITDYGGALVSNDLPIHVGQNHGFSLAALNIVPENFEIDQLVSTDFLLISEGHVGKLRHGIAGQRVPPCLDRDPERLKRKNPILWLCETCD